MSILITITIIIILLISTVLGIYFSSPKYISAPTLPPSPSVQIKSPIGYPVSPTPSPVSGISSSFVPTLPPPTLPPPTLPPPNISPSPIPSPSVLPPLEELTKWNMLYVWIGLGVLGGFIILLFSFRGIRKYQKQRSLKDKEKDKEKDKDDYEYDQVYDINKNINKNITRRASFTIGDKSPIVISPMVNENIEYSQKNVRRASVGEMPNDIDIDSYAIIFKESKKGITSLITKKIINIERVLLVLSLLLSYDPVELGTIQSVIDNKNPILTPQKYLLILHKIDDDKLYKGKPKSETMWIKLFRLWTNYQEDPKDPKEYENPFDLFEKYIEKNFKKKYLDRLLRKEDIQQLKIQFENLKTPDLIGLIGLDDIVIRQIIKTQFLFILHRKNIQIVYQKLLNENKYILYLPYVMNTENKPTVIANNKIQGYTLEEIILKGIKYGQKIKKIKKTILNMIDEAKANIQEPDRNKDGIEMYSFIEVCLFYLNQYRQTINQPFIRYPYDEFFKIIKPNIKPNM